MGLYAGNAEISDTANLLIFEACLAVVDEYVYGAVSENYQTEAHGRHRGAGRRRAWYQAGG